MKRPILLLEKLASASDKNIIEISTGGVKTIRDYIAYLEENQNKDRKQAKALTSDDLYFLDSVIRQQIGTCNTHSMLASSKEDRDRNKEMVKRLTSIRARVERLYCESIQ